MVWTLGAISLLNSWRDWSKTIPEPDDSENAAGQDDKVAEVVAEWHTCENRERSMKLSQVISAQLSSCMDTTHFGTHSAIDGNDDTHDSVTKDTGANCHFPAEADSNDGRSCTIQSSAPPLSKSFNSRSQVLKFQPDNSHGEKLTDFPVRNGPGIGHPVSYIGAPIPSPFRRRNGIEIGIGGILRGRETAGLLADLEAEVGEASLSASRVTDFDGGGLYSG